jgi:V/A-type H+-transporting ATPase subunit F
LYKVIVITDPETADGFRLAGVDVVAAETPESAGEHINALMDEENAGILAVNQGFYEAIDQRIESVYRPIVVPIPVKEIVEVGEERSAYLARLIHRAIGFDITLKAGEGEGAIGEERYGGELLPE